MWKVQGQIEAGVLKSDCPQPPPLMAPKSIAHLLKNSLIQSWEIAIKRKESNFSEYLFFSFSS